MEVAGLFWDVGAVLFSEAQISRPEFKPVLDLLDMTPDESDNLFTPLWEKWLCTGDMAENDYWQEYLKVSKRKPTITEIKTLYRSCIRVNQELLDKVKRLSHKYDQYILSNHGREWMDYLVEHWSLDKYFKDIFCSGHLKLRKPNLNFYQLALLRSDKNPAEVLYIDDNQTYIDAAKSLGINGLLYRGYLDAGLSDLKADLLPLV